MQRPVILIMGQTGSGKTHLARELLKSHPRVLILDAGFGEFPQSEVAAGPEQLLALCSEREYFGGARPFRLAYTPLPDEYDVCFQLAYELGNCILVLEECDRFQLDDLRFYSECIFRGRHRGVGIIGITLHPYAMPKELRRQCTELYSFRQTEPSDLKYLEAVIGEDVLKLPELSGPPARPPHPYLHWTPNDGSKIIRSFLTPSDRV